MAQGYEGIQSASPPESLAALLGVCLLTACGEPFVSKTDPLSRGEMSRRQHFEIDEGVSLPLASAEDIVLRKLAWFRKGGGVSERQWRDVLGVIRVRGDDLDLEYLREAAAGEGLTELLDEALAAAVAT